MKRVFLDPYDIAFDAYCEEKARRKAAIPRNLFHTKAAFRRAYVEFIRKAKILSPPGRFWLYYQRDMRVDYNNKEEFFTLYFVTKWLYYLRLIHSSDLAISRIACRYFDCIVWDVFSRSNVGFCDPFCPRPKTFAASKKNKALFLSFIEDPSNVRVKRESYWRPMLPWRAEEQKKRWATKWIGYNTERWEAIRRLCNV